MSSSSASDAAVIKMFSHIPSLLDQTPGLIRRGQRLSCECLLGPTSHPFHVSICNGAIVDMTPGRIVLNLAIDHASEFGALIGLEAADYQAPWYDTSWLNRPDVHGGEVCAALVSGLIAPQSPPAARQETLWCYKQGGPAVFKGDLYFYRVDGDLRGRVEAIDTAACPLYLLTGEYDFPAHRTTRSAPRPSSRAPMSPSWSSSAIFR